MATGIPSSKSLANQGVFEITYPNKIPFDEVLLGERALLDECQVPDAEGQLYCGDNLAILRTLTDDPRVLGKVDLVYIDPPFATGSNFESRKQTHAYSDDLQGSVFLEFIRQRVILIRELLSDRGSLYLHLDSRMICETKMILDEVFGRKNFRALITRKKSNPKNYTRNSYGNVADYILFYTKTDNYIWNRQTTPPSEKQLKEYRYIDKSGRRHMRVPIHAPGVRNGETGKEWRGMLPPQGKHWQYKPSKLEELDKNGHIYWSATGNPRKKVYLDTHGGVSVQDIWMDFKDAHNQNCKITGYPTEKNPDLLERIIQASSDKDSLVLDCFSGSGTTVDIAGKLERSWIGVDCSFEAISTICQRIVYGTAKMGDFRNCSEEKNEEVLLFPEAKRKFGLSVERSLVDALIKYAQQEDGHQPDTRPELLRLLKLINSESIESSLSVSGGSS